MITSDTLKDAKRYAAEVAKLCGQVEADIERCRKAERAGAPFCDRQIDTVLTATLRRRSMDLTRALAELRRR